MKEEDKLDFKKDDPSLNEPEDKVQEMTLEEWEKAQGIQHYKDSDDEELPPEKRRIDRQSRKEDEDETNRNDNTGLYLPNAGYRAQ